MLHLGVLHKFGDVVSCVLLEILHYIFRQDADLCLLIVKHLGQIWHQIVQECDVPLPQKINHLHDQSCSHDSHLSTFVPCAYFEDIILQSFHHKLVLQEVKESTLSWDNVAFSVFDEFAFLANFVDRYLARKRLHQLLKLDAVNESSFIVQEKRLQAAHDETMQLNLFFVESGPGFLSGSFFPDRSYLRVFLNSLMNVRKITHIVIEQVAKIAHSKPSNFSDQGIYEFDKGNFFLQRFDVFGLCLAFFFSVVLYQFGGFQEFLEVHFEDLFRTFERELNQSINPSLSLGEKLLPQLNLVLQSDFQ